MEYSLRDLIDIPQLAKLLDSLDAVQTMPSAIVDMEGNVLTAAAWQDVCTKFHRAHPDTERQCRESDTYFANKLCDQGGHFIYKCPMGLVDTATPIIVEGKHIGNVFTGQLFLEPPDEAAFLDQAQRFGFDQIEYLKAVRKVPVFTEEQLHKNLTFLHQLAEMLANEGLKKKRLMEAEEALRESEKDLRKAQHVAHVGSWTWNIKANHLDWSDEMYRIFGIEKDKFHGVLSEVIAQAIHPDDRAAVEQSNLSVTQQGIPVPLEYRVIWPDGAVRVVWAEAGEITLDEVGEPAILTGIVQDITDRKQAEASLRLSQEKFNDIFYLCPDSMSINRLEDGIYLDVNQNFANIFGYNPKEVMGRSSLPGDLGIWVDKSDRDQLLEKVRADGEVIGFETQLRRKDSTVITALESWKRLEINGEECLLSVTRDITDRKRMEVALRESEEKYRSLVSDMQVGVLIQGPQTEILLSNPKALELLGLSENQLLGKTSFDPEWNVIHEDGSPFSGPTMPVPQAVATKQAVRETIMGVYQPVRKDRIWLSVDAEPQVDPDGTVRQVVCTFVDITARKQAEEERRILLERMAQIQKLEALGVLVAGVAHNLNNVLAAIMATASLREKLASEAKELEAFRIIGTACRRGRDVVKSLTQFAQPALSNPAPIELHALITEVRVLLENTTSNRISIVEEFFGEPLWIYADAGGINHALVNLCLNSLDAMSNGGTLTFRTAAPGKDWVEVSVEDGGEGMTPEVLARVREPFFTTKEVGKGTGLGLSMTHGVIKAHGGSLEISSVVGQGTMVRLRLPQIPAPIVEKSLATPTSSVGPMNVLLVDDDEDVRFLVARMLKNAGLQIKTVAGGEEALESLMSGPLPDLIILDQNMPKMNGIQTMEKIRALHSDVPILISSGQPDIEGWDCFKQPNVAVISKPFEMDELLAKVAKMSLNPETTPKG